MRSRYRLITSKNQFTDLFGLKASYDGPGLYNLKTGYMMDAGQGDVISAPMVMRDTPDYYSVVSDKWVTSRSWRREDLKRTGCIEMDPPRKRHKRPLINKAFAERNGKPELWDKDRAQDHERDRKAKTTDIAKNLYGKGL
jgi:hypothetical protein